MDPNMDPKKRLQLNFGGLGGGGYSNDRNYAPTNERVFPTTPSTFPQSVFPASNAANEYVSAQIQTNYAGQNAGYFPTGAYQTQYSPQSPYSQAQYQGQYQYQTPQHNLAAPQSSYQQQRQTGYNSQDPNSGLARQFSNQNLGTPHRLPSPYGRQPSPGARQYQNGQQPTSQQNRNQVNYVSNQQSHSTLLTPSTTNGSGRSLSASTEEPPEKNANKYSSNIQKRGHGLHALVEAYFKENISRARDRNIRARDLEQYLRNDRNSEEDKRRRIEDTRNNENQYLRFLRTKESPANFVTLNRVGKGAFGEVKLVQRRRDGKIYALKSLVKTEMFKKDQLAHVRAERDILAEADSPWVVKLHTTFQDNTFLYMLMEFLPGGDLMTMLIKYEIFSLPITRFYIAQLVLAIQDVHKHGYIHRDIKPDNILLDRGGHVKLTDFGLSTGFHKQHDNSYYQELLKGTSTKNRNINRNSVSLDQINLTISNRAQINTWRKSNRRTLAYSTVGTPDYIAPEIFSGKGYSFACDWWSVGAIMFECLVGWPPFCAEDAHDTYRKIVNWRSTLYFPDDNPLLQSREAEQWPAADDCIRRSDPVENPQNPDPLFWMRAKDFIHSMLCDPSDRLGGQSGQNGAQEIKAHPFFNNVQWNDLRTIRAPFEPQLSSNVDVSYFPIDEIPQEDTSAAHRKEVDALGEEHSADMALPFIGYTFKRFETMKN